MDAHTVSEKMEDDFIEIKNVDVKIKENTKEHHTDSFEITKEFLIVRRGQKFDINLEFSRGYDKDKDDIHLVFRFGKIPRPTKGTYVDLILSDEDKPNEWQAKILDNQSFGKSMKLEINTPPTCPVGKWELSFDVIKKGDKGDVVRTFDQNGHLYILFNPWCKDDQVYMPDEILLKEYVLNENGEIYRGSAWSMSGKKWNFGQFQDVVLDCCLYLLDKEEGMSINRGDSVMVSRKISAVVNSSDDRGVLTGNWSGDYEGGRSPLSWAGSHNILTEYYNTKRPVKYGQCWVFSGLVTTVCRALGIPARSVTNFASAHDTDSSVTIDEYIDEDGEPLDDLNGDSVWNFHVWNDVWMSRPDLKQFKDYQEPGWQAIDATPQETSYGMFCMGPMPLKAIKEGDLNVPYDGPFVFAEVNADRETWMKRKNGRFVHIDTRKNSVGINMSTRKPNAEPDSWLRRMDVTKEYKYSEGTEKEREVVKKAEGKFSERGEKTFGKKDIAIDVSYNTDTLIGDDLLVTVKISNTGTDRRTVTGKLSVDSRSYTDEQHMNIAKTPLEKGVIEPGTDISTQFTYTAEQYLDKFEKIDHFNFRLFGFIMADKTEKCAVDKITGRFKKPDLTVTADTTTTPKVGTEYKVKVSFVNPLNKPLTECYLSLDGPIWGNEDRKVKDVLGKTEKGTVSETIIVYPNRSGEMEIVINFNSIELTGIDGSIKINVSE